MSRGLPYNVKQCLEKSRDSALLAVETYNKPAIKFRSGGYIVLMVISLVVWLYLKTINGTTLTMRNIQWKTQ